MIEFGWAFFASQNCFITGVPHCVFILPVFGYFLPGFTIQGYNARNVEVVFCSDGQEAQTNYDVYNYDDLVAEGTSRTWGVYEGVWYQNGGFMCTPDGVIKEEFLK